MEMATTGTGATDGQNQYWVDTVSLDHVDRGVRGGFMQADHGADRRLKQLGRNDWVVFYSPRSTMRGGSPVQAFTAIGRVTDDHPYQVKMTPDFHPWRRRVTYRHGREAPVRPLIGDLDFIRDKQRWGYPFRRGLFRISEEDFLRIAGAMGVDPVR